MNHKLTLLALPIAAATLAACGSSSSDKTTTSAARAPAALSASNDLTVDATDYSFAPATLTARAGKVKLTLKNSGKLVHEVVVLKTDQAADALKANGAGRVSEKDSVGEVSETDAGKTKTSTLDLKPGRYVYVCNIPGHYGLGMHGTLTVR